MRLARLAPEITEAIQAGQHPAHLLVTGTWPGAQEGTLNLSASAWLGGPEWPPG